MARLRRRGRRVGRVVVPVLAGGCVLLAAYLIWPSGGARSVEAEPVPAASPALAAVTEKPPVVQQPTQKAPEPEPRPPAEPDPDAEPAAGSQPPVNQPKPPAVSAGMLAQAKALLDDGKLLESRKVLNDALQAGTLDPAAAEQVKARIRDLNQTIIFTPSRRYEADPQQSTYTVQPGDNLVKICRNLDVPHGFIARVNAVKPERIRAGQSLKLIQGPIHAVVNKKSFTMDLYLGDLPGKPGSMYLATYRVGLGEDGSTPTGLWEVSRNSKTVNPAWTNPRTNEVFDRDDPLNPLGERWIGLTGIAGNAVGAVSYGIHGTIEPETIGTNSSMGCIRLKHEDVVEIFDMLSEGRSLVMIVEE